MTNAKRVGSVAATLVLCSLAAARIAGQTKADPEPELSTHQLSGDQVAIYRALIQEFQKDSKDSLNIAETTDVFDEREIGEAGSCAKGFTFEHSDKGAPLTHHIDARVTAGLKAALVDPKRQAEKVKSSDPEVLMKKAIDGGQRVAKADIDVALQIAFRQALFSLSEVGFNKDHTRAIASYGFYCGSLCGNGARFC